MKALIRILRQHRGLALAVLISSQLIALAYWFVLPRHHMATALVLVDTRPSPVRSVTGDPSVPVIGARAALLMSDLVAERVVKRLRLDEVVLLRETWARQGEQAGSFMQWLIRVAQGGLMPTSGRGGYLMQVRYVASDPGFARTMANAYAEELVATVDRLNRLDDAALEAPLAAGLQRQLSRMADAHGELLTLSQRTGVLQAGLDDPSFRADDRLQRETVMGLLASQQAAATSRTLQGSAEARSVLDDAVLQRLRIELAELTRKQEAEMASRGVNHPAVASLDAAIQRTQQEIRDHVALLSRSMGAVADIAEDSRVQRDQAGAQARGRLLASLDDRAAYDRAQSRFDAAAEEYITMAISVATLAANRDVSKSDIVLVEPAALPDAPWFPRWQYVLPVALASGLLFALLACVVADRRDRRVATAEELRGLVGADLVLLVPGALPAQRPNPAGSDATRSSWLRSAIRPLLSPVMPWRRSRKVLRR